MYYKSKYSFLFYLVDITTVLLVDNHGKSSLGRYLSVKPDLGLITSTARTFIQDGVTTEYATQVLGTTLDNGRLYAHLLTKTSRVVYDHDSQTKVHDPYTPKHWNLDESQIFDKNFVRNTDFISPASSQPVHVTPTSIFKSEILNEAPSNNARVPFGPKKMLVKPQEEVAVVKSQNDLTHENLIIHNDNPILKPSKVKEWDNLPTFTVRNEFSPSGFSSVENMPDFDTKTERSKLSTPADRQARLLFKAGLIKPILKDLQTVTYTGFADFTTTVANTVIVFTPHTSEIPEPVVQITKSSVSSIRPTQVLHLPQVTKSVTTTTEKQFPTFLTTEEVPTTTPITTTTSSIEDQEEDEIIEEKFNTSGINTMVINKEDRDGKHQSPDEPIDLDAKFSVLANEQKQNDNTLEQTVTYTKDIIQPSETQPVMLSTPNSDDIARIIASLQAAQATQPLQMTTQTTEEVATPSIKTIGGATTIFFEDDDFSFEPTTSSSKLLLTTATTTTEQIPITEKNEETTTEFELTTFPLTTLNEIEDDEPELECTGEWKVVPTTVFKTLTYLTTYFIPLESSTSTSVQSNVVVTDEVSSQTIQCKPTKIFETTTELSSVPATEPMTTTEKEALLTTTEEENESTTTTANKPEVDFTTQTEEITTEKQQHVTESEPETTEVTTENGDEVELIFKTLYTTYTYLTTYFQDSTSSVASRIVVNTNVITSTLEPGSESSDAAVEGLLVNEEPIIPSRAVSFEDLAGIQSSVLSGNDVSSSDDENVANSATATPALDDKLLQTANGIKTFYTTYTYFTTIFVDGETEISSRTEVYTNYVTPTAPTEVLSTKLNDEELLENRLRSLKLNSQITQQDEENYILPSNTKQGYVTLNRGGSKPEIDNDIIDLSEYETIETMVTDVRSSTSKGEERIIDNIDKRNILLDDQIVSESNNESEIVPSPPTLLLQTSYTTFTYFTTKYHGTTSSDIVSRLETVTNVVTTTLTPTQTLSTEDMSLPVTYFTTFTYWTTLYKDGQTKITSREETVSNVVTPGFSSTEPPEAVIPLITPTVQPHDDIKPTQALEKSVVPSTVGDDKLTTYYTTYTYYTTSYIGDDTVLNSRLETVTNVLNNTGTDNNQVGRAVSEGEQNKIDETNIKPTGLLSSLISTVDNNGTATVFSTDVYGTYIKGLYAKVLESTSSILQNLTSTETTKENLKPTGVVSINQGKIVDADGISTLLYTTQAVGTYVDGSYAEVIESTSSLVVDTEKKAALGSNVPVAHRTGLVRSIDGSIIQNKTTTLYQSKVLGTVIDGRYAQIIESTSSFILPTITPSAVIPEVSVTATKLANNLEANSVITPTPVVIEGSISDTTSKNEEESKNETDEEEEEDGDKDEGRNKSRLSFQSKKRTFTPAIRPFASRQRPTFAPKRSKTGATTAATITRSDFTPTVTAIPASKANRFGGRRSSSSGNIQPTASGNKRFSRPKATRSSNSQAKVTSSGFRRGSSTRSTSAIRPTSLFGGGNSRFRIRPTAASGLNRSPSSKIVTETPPDSENDLTTSITEESLTDSSGEAGDTTLPLQTTTESARSRNPLLRFRRPPVTRGSQVIRTTPKPRTTKATTTTSRPKTSPTRPNALLNRQRAGGLFPRRNLFTTTTTTEAAPEEELLEEEGDEEANEEGNEEEDVDYESSHQLTRTETAPTTPKPVKPFNAIQIRPFKRRSKRQAIYSRFRRPGIRSTTAAPSTTEAEYIDVSTPKPSFRNRYQGIKYRSGKSQQQQSTTTTTTQAPQRKQRISPTRPQSGTRAQFTLREKDATSRSFQPRNGSIRRTTTSAPRSNSRARSGFLPDSASRRTTTNTRNSRTRVRTTSRGRTYDQNVDDNFVAPKFDGTITVTYKIPTEVTIPVVNGKITEYKNIVTAKLSTEVLSPNQYSTTLNPLGKEVKILVTENSSVNDNGATFITQYLLNETPTTSVIFTPTQIRGRQTSFSHVIPSTAYQVEEVVNTIQPALAAQAPLANILLSQLLLGGGVPTNPLLALQNNPGVPATPTTEFKTRTTTYVTTVTSTLQTVLPLTFRGKEILTTISDTSTQVVTATEYLTDTVVVTPTLFNQAPQLNTLLLPLLQQQLQQQQLQQQQANQLLQAQSPANVFTLPEPQAQQTFVNSAENLEEFNLADDEEIVTSPRSAEVTDTPKRKPKKTTAKRKPTKVTPPKETSVITLYVSGRTPGEFTTVLSTVTVGEDARRKRSVDYVPVRPSRSLEDLSVESRTIDRFVEPASKVLEDIFDVSSKETESLESIIGDVPKHMRTKTPSLFNDKPSIATKKYSIKYVRATEDQMAKNNFLA